MKTNLIFTRQIIQDGMTQVVTKIVPVEVPHINSGEGWILKGHTDIIELMNTPDYNITASVNNTASECQTSEEAVNKPVKEAAKDTKFITDIQGTAKLVRSKGVIKIVARRGKATYNQTTPNSVCIDDCTKANFFKDCRAIHGNNGCYEFSAKDGRPYDYWNDIIDKEYLRQQKRLTRTTS